MERFIKTCHDVIFFPLFVVKEEISEVKLIIFISLNISMMGKISVRA